MRRRPIPLISAGLLCAVLTTTACGTRMDRGDIALAERGGLQLAAGAGPAATAGDSTAPAGVQPGNDPGTLAGAAAIDTGASAPSVTGTVGLGSSTGGNPSAAAAGHGSAGTTTKSAAGAGSPAAVGSTAAAAGRSAGAAGNRSPQGGGPAPVPGQPAPDTPAGGRSTVAVGTVATLSGPVGAFVKDSIFAVSVWAKWINGKGGVNGHPVRHIVADDGGDPARYNANVRQLVEEQGVIGFIFNTLGFAGGDLSYVNQKRVPIIGHEGGTEEPYSSPMVFTPFPSGLSYAYTLIAGLAQYVVPEGKTKLASIACSDVKLCDLFDKTWNGPTAKELGFENVYRARSSLTQPDFTAECISARQAGAQVIIGALDNNSYLRLARSCARQNYKPVIGIADQLALPSLAADPVMDGDVVATKVAPWPDTSVPGTAELHQVFAQVAPDVPVNGAHAGAWVTAKTFELAARNLPDKPTPADLLNGLWAINGDDIGGMTFPLHFPKDQPSPRKSCWGTALVSGGKFVTPPNGKLKCK
jgi:ABC-type branched-subunit amino acid transport system substrate-binding protein